VKCESAGYHLKFGRRLTSSDLRNGGSRDV
jgi:hypothetical protein